MFQIRMVMIGIIQLLVAAVFWSPSAHAVPSNDVFTRREAVHLPVTESKGLAFKRISTADGLSQARVSHIIQDDKGFIWFGTQYGINRYDGYGFKYYAHDPADARSAAGTVVISLFKDRDGFIWIGWANGLDRLDPTTEKFSHYFTKGDDSRNSITIVHMSQDRQGILWLATGSGLRGLNPANNKVIEYRHSSDPASLPSDDVNWSGEDSQGRFWVGTSKGLTEFDRGRGKVLRTIPTPNPYRIRMFEDRRGEFWIVTGTGTGLALFNPKKNTITPYSFYKDDPGPIGTPGVADIAEGRDGSLWLATNRSGLLRLDPERKHFQHYGNPAENQNGIAGNDAISLLLDRDDNIWMGLNSGGVNYFGSGLPKIEVFRHYPGDPNSLTRDFVNAALKDKDGTLWIGNYGGLNRIDGKTGQRDVIDLHFGTTSTVISLAQTDDGVIWVGTYARGLTLYDPKKKTVENFMHDPARPGSISNDEIHRVFVDRARTVWVATDDGLDSFDPLTRSFTTYKLQANNRWGQNYLSIAEDAKGNFWLGTISSGLHRFDPVTGKLEVFGRMTEELNGDWVVSVLTSRLGTLWLGTSSGLKSLNLKTGALRLYSMRNGMPSNSISCILEDERGDIWMSTTKGLSALDPKTETFTNYSMIDELGGNDLTGWGGCSKSPDGELFFGGFDGAVGFYPKAFQVAQPKAKLAFTDIEINGAKPNIGPGQPLDRDAAYAEKVTLSPGQHALSVTFSGLNYGNSHATRYRYRLEKFEDVWHVSPSSVRQATYAALPSGQYKLNVQMASDGRDWQAPGISLAILALPYWWETWWFSTSCLMTLVILSWWAMRVRVRNATREVTLQLEARNNERMRIADDLHDTLLQGLLGASMKVSVIQDLLPTSAEARPLLDRLSDLLRQLVAEGRNAVGGLRKWDFDPNDLGRAIATVPGDLQIESTAQFRETIEGDVRPLLPAARNEVYLIAREAISNALRHANASKIEVELEYLADSFSLKVRDDGRGFTADEASGKKSEHFGLSVMRQRAGRFNATLTVSSGVDAGTEIVLSVPGRKIYQPKTTK